MSVPYEDITYNSNYPIIELTVLPYMGSGSAEETGFILVPDGNGGVITFNNGKTGLPSYYNNIYVWD